MPFRRLTALFFNFEAYDDISVAGFKSTSDNLKYGLVKARLFEYANFYK